MKKQYTSAFKAKLVVELLKESTSLSQLAAEHKVHPNQLRYWRDQVLQDLPTLFEKEQQSAAAQAAHEQQTKELYAQIGRLTTQVGGLKKNLALTLTRPERVALVERAAHAASGVVVGEPGEFVLSRRRVVAGGSPAQASD